LTGERAEAARIGEDRPTNRPRSGSERRRGAIEAPTCGDSRKRVLLVPYVLARLQDRRAEVFEAHLLQCEACFRDLKILDRATRLVREHLRLDPHGLDDPARPSPGHPSQPPTDGAPLRRIARRTSARGSAPSDR
jgi:anti-sigma factor RsiW